MFDPSPMNVILGHLSQSANKTFPATIYAVFARPARANHVPRDKMTIGEPGPPVLLLFLIAINERIASELLARNRRITDKNAMWTMFS